MFLKPENKYTITLVNTLFNKDNTLFCLSKLHIVRGTTSRRLVFPCNCVVVHTCSNIVAYMH